MAKETCSLLCLIWGSVVWMNKKPGYLRPTVVKLFEENKGINIEKLKKEREKIRKEEARKCIYVYFTMKAKPMDHMN